jgi:hypothetical protein
MPKAEIVFRVLDGNRIECRVVAPSGRELRLRGATANAKPEFTTGDLGDNRALVTSSWAFAMAEFAAVNLPDREQQKYAKKRAEGLRKEAEWIADVAGDLTDQERQGWCSACFGKHDHRKANRPGGQLGAYVCVECGTPTLPCVGPGCQNMAVRGHGAVRVPSFCAEHRHEIPGFEKAARTMESLGDYEEFLKYDKPNLARAAKIAGVAGLGLIAGGPLAFISAAAIGGAVGAVAGGYAGAAATSYGLALLGGGSLAAGGLGMAGGTLVVTGLGAALGGGLGGAIANAYVREDKSFHIEMLQGGPGVPVVVCNGFLSESGRGWGEWREIITKRYPNSTVYRVHWGAKELKHLGIFGASGAAKFAVGAAAKELAAKAAKWGAKRLGPLGPLLFATDLAKNPWHVAKNRAEKTGAVVADLIARTDADSYVLIGHSLGARAMVFAAQVLGTKAGGPRVQDAHLLGAAIGAKGDWHALISRVDGAVYNYHSVNDGILKFVYPAAEAGQGAAGFRGFRRAPEKVQNIDVSAEVETHFAYVKNVALK